jgi:hypothetical protein
VNYVLIIAAFLLGVAVTYGIFRLRGRKFDGELEVTQDSKSIFAFNPTIEPEELAKRDRISIRVIRKGPAVS